MKDRKLSLTASNLKWIAIILMFLNHICYCAYSYLGVDNYFFSNAHWYLTRISFLIFAYQIAEGMHYTRNREKYINSLFIFAFASEIPYDLCFCHTILEFEDQNVFFNLALGATAIYVIDLLGKKPVHIFGVTLVTILISLGINANYGATAEAIIVAFYYLRDDKKKQLSISALVFFVFNCVDYAIRFAGIMTVAEMMVSSRYWYNCAIELHGLLAWPLFNMYSGEKGKNLNKWFFYFFYPAHLIFIYVFTLVMQ